MAVEISGRSVLLNGAGSGVGLAAAVEFPRRGADERIASMKDDLLAAVQGHRRL